MILRVRLLSRSSARPLARSLAYDRWHFAADVAVAVVVFETEHSAERQLGTPYKMRFSDSTD